MTGRRLIGLLHGCIGKIPLVTLNLVNHKAVVLLCLV